MFKLRDPTPPFAWSRLGDGRLRPGEYKVEFSPSIEVLDKSMDDCFQPVDSETPNFFDLVTMRDFATVIHTALEDLDSPRVPSREHLQKAIAVFNVANIVAVTFLTPVALSSLSVVASGPNMLEYREWLDVFSRRGGELVHHAEASASLNYRDGTGVLSVYPGDTIVCGAEVQMLVHRRVLSTPKRRRTRFDILVVQIEKTEGEQKCSS